MMVNDIEIPEQVPFETPRGREVVADVVDIDRGPTLPQMFLVLDVDGTRFRMSVLEAQR
jgi:hypothetical protein